MKIAVAGSSGIVGRHVVRAARARGHDVVGLSRSDGVDLTSGSQQWLVVAGQHRRAESRRGAAVRAWPPSMAG